jgi:homoserine kinase type II
MQTRLDESIIKVSARWGLEVRYIRKDIEICGSPERCEFRFVIECADNHLYVIESVIDDETDNKRKIIFSLNYLYEQGLSGINPYLSTDKNASIVKCDDRFWQISRFISGIALERPAYIFDQWRGNVLADFLIRLREKSVNIPGFNKKTPFSIINYINTLNNQIKAHEPELQKEIQPVIDFLDKYFIDTHDQLPVTFCHGDYHPLNVLWATDHIHAVIDWEFSGIKPEIYDMANLIGCIGIENPEALAGLLVIDFIKTLKKSNIISNISWSVLVEFVIALRFAWLSEWLRHNDKEMIELESDYLKLLVNNADDLKQIWEI